MPATKKNKPSHRHAAGVLPALALVLSLSDVHAATLGPISVLSSLGEPLSAEIEIFDLTEHENSDLDVALASEMDFEKSGGTRSAVMESLKLRIVQQGRRRLIQLNTEQPLAQPIYGLMIELRTENESTLAEFEVLPQEPVKVTETNTLDAPATVDTAQPEPNAQSVQPEQATALEPAADAAPTEAEVAGKGAENLALGGSSPTHTVQRGESLGKIARLHSVPQSELDKFITAVYNENPDAFFKQNLHYLKTGAVLALPSEEAISQIDEKLARKHIASQWRSFQTLVPAKESSSGGESANRSSSKKLTASGTTSSSTKGDRLTLAALKPNEAGAKTEEEAIAARKAAEEASERVRLLEKNILDLKSSIQPGKPETRAGEDSNDSSGKDESLWGVLASPARDLMMQFATVLLLATLVVISFLRRNPK